MKQFPFYETRAHDNDPLVVHLEQVANRAADSVSAATSDVRLIAFISGLFHDIGKATPFFQVDRLEKQRKTMLTTHAKCGAAIAWWFTGLIALPVWIRLSIFISILKHHGNLNFNSWKQSWVNVSYDLENEQELKKQIESLDLAGLRNWLQKAVEKNTFLQVTSDFIIPEITMEKIKKSFRSVRSKNIRSAFFETHQVLSFLSGFGALLAADKIHAAIGVNIKRKEIPCNMVDVYKNYEFSQCKTEIDIMREAIAAEVKQTWLDNIDKKLYTLTSPTGSGKTLSILNGALSVRYELTQKRPSRIIYCLPFTSVIDQNHQVFQRVLNTCSLGQRDDILLKHHHLVEGLFRTDEAEYLPDGAGQLLTETWQSEIVVTTFYQLLHSLLSTKNSALKRAGQLCGSIILMDEVQTIPLKYWRTLRRILGVAATVFKAKFVLLTATRPLIFRPDDSEICELLPNHPHYFQKLSRVTLHCHHQNLSLSEFTETIIENIQKNFCSTLIILNRRKSVAEVFNRLCNAFPTQRIVALSTNLTPWDRKARIRLICSFLRRKISCILVSTQLIEAGVDVSFPVVHREIAPLDSVVQTCGRSNRHNTDQGGNIHLWKIFKDSNDSGLSEPLWQRVYDSHLIDVTMNVLKIKDDGAKTTQFDEKEFLNLSKKYFELCWEREQQTDLEKLWIKGNFGELNRAFQLIPDGIPTVTCFVVKSAMDEKLWEKYSAITTDENLSPIEKKLKFNMLRKKFYERIIQVYVSMDYDRESIILLRLSDKTYTRTTGFINLPEKESSCIF